MIAVAPLFLARRYASLNFVVGRLSSAIIKITAWPNFSKGKIAAGAWITCIQLQHKWKCETTCADETNAHQNASSLQEILWQQEPA